MNADDSDVAPRSLPEDGEWTPELEVRRGVLMDKELSGELKPGEFEELERLQRVADDYFDRVAPPPLAGVEALLRHLISKHGG